MKTALTIGGMCFAIEVPGCLLIAWLAAIFSFAVNGRGVCPDGLQDTTYTNASLPSYPRQTGTLFRVTRVVGPGTPEEYFMTNSLDLPTPTAVSYVLNDVLEPTARLGTFTRLSVMDDMWPSLSTIPGVTSARVSANYIFRLNGVQVGRSVKRSVTLNATTPNVPPGLVQRSECMLIEAIRIRFARRLINDDPTLPEFSCPPDFYAQRLPGRTCPGINELSVTIQGPYIDLVGVDGQVIQGTGLGLTYAGILQAAYGKISTSGGGTKLVFDAMAPVILVHGIRSGPTPNYRTAVGAIQDPNEKPDWFESYLYPPPGANTSAPVWFKQPFRDSKVPLGVARFVDTLLRDSIGLVSLSNQPTASAAIAAEVAKFGAAYCHLVGHSGGGLWSKRTIRAQIEQDIPAHIAGFRIRSINTVDTPHFGSAHADVTCAVSGRCPPVPAAAWSSVADYPLTTDRLWSDLMPDLQTETASAFTLQGDPVELELGAWRHAVSYTAVGADANVNESCEGGVQPHAPPLTTPPNSTNCSPNNLPTIQDRQDRALTPGTPDESIGYEPPDPDVSIPGVTDELVWTTITNPVGAGQRAYRRLMLNDQAETYDCSPVYYRCIRFVSSGGPNLNDFSVALWSMFPGQGYPGLNFREIARFRANHTSVGSAQSGQVVLDAIKAAEFDLTYAPRRVR